MSIVTVLVLDEVVSVDGAPRRTGLLSNVAPPGARAYSWDGTTGIIEWQPDLARDPEHFEDEAVLDPFIAAWNEAAPPPPPEPLPDEDPPP